MTTGAAVVPDKDGLVNRIEYAFARNPLSDDIGSLITAMTDGDAVNIRYQRRRNLAGSPIKVEISADLKVWQAAGAAVSESGTTIIDATKETVTLTLENSMDVRFLRLSVSE